MEGYAKLGNLMGADRTDGHFLIFQKFEPISAQNLLYLQAEIITLKESLEKIVDHDSKSGYPEKEFYTRDWEALTASPDSPQWEKWLELRSKLKEYYKAIAHHRMITGLPAPNRHDLKFLRGWLDRLHLENFAFVGADSDVYEKSDGLVTLAAKGGDFDAMTNLLVHVIPALCHKFTVRPLHKIFGKWVKKPEGLRACSSTCATSQTSVEPKTSQDSSSTSAPSTVEPSALSSSDSTCPSPPFDVEANMFLYRDTHFFRIATVLGTLISSLIPIAAIIVLSFVKNMTARLGIVCAFTAIFSVCLSLVTEAKRVENFAATAAFASVQVVFVGSTNWGMG